jgi:hypothetical protein
VALIQLDDLSHVHIELVRTVAFLALETSPKNYQAWIAMRQADDGFKRQLRKCAGADPSASGATRIAGSFNFKDKYAPNYPLVEIKYSRAGCIVSKEQLAESGLQGDAPESPGARHAYPSLRLQTTSRRWPSYQRCLDGAPPTHDGSRPDVSRADFTWCMIAIDWGWCVEETDARLREESPKAQLERKAYAELTARRAADAVRVGRQLLFPVGDNYFSLSGIFNCRWPGILIVADQCVSGANEEK